MRRIPPVLVVLVALPVLGLLAACGDRGGEGVREGLRVVLVHGNNSRPYLPWPAEVAKQVAGDLEDVGFEVAIDMQPWSSYIPYVENGRHQLAILGWSADVPDTDNFLSALLHEDSAEVGSANNISFYRSREVSDLLDRARLTHDEAVRDGVVLDLQYEARDIDQNITSQEKIDQWFEIKTRGLNDLAKAQLKQRWGTMQKVLSSLDRLEKNFGKTEVPWGDIHVVNRGERFPLGGNWTFENLHPDYGPEMENGEIHCDDGWGHVLVVVEGDRKEIWSLLPYGQSQHPDSPHYNDQARLHSERELKRFWFYPEEIREHTESVRGEEGRIETMLP